MIGPPDPISNLRPIIFANPPKETYLEKRYRELREETQQWNQIFWSKHNTSFIKVILLNWSFNNIRFSIQKDLIKFQEREQFQQMLKAQGKVTLTADDMSVFYKQFLDQNWQTHFNYNIAWYKRNIKILFFGIAVKVSKLKFK